MSFEEGYLESINWNPRDHLSVDMLKILWHSVAPQIRSGYGTITRHIIGRLFQLEYDTIISAYYGIEAGGVVLINGVPCVPCARHMGSFGEGSYKQHFKSFQRNVGILASDFWAFPWFPGDGRYSIMYSPMDHVNYAPHLRELVKKYDKVASFLPFQQKELESYGTKSTVVPHGVDKIFTPMDQTEARKEAKFDTDAFMIGIVSANSDKEMRKSWGEIFTAAEYIKNNYPDIHRDIRYFCHVDPEDPKGVSLKGLAHLHGVLERFGFEDSHLSVVGIPDIEMRLLYNSFDVLLCPSKREGFGLPILEAMACGTPVIAHNFSSMPDLVGHNAERGWLVDTALMTDTPILATSAIPSVDSIVEQILDAYNNEQKRKEKGEAAAEFAKTMYWDDIVTKYWVPLLDEVAEELNRTPSEEVARIEI